MILKKAGLKPRALECIRSSLGNALRPRVQDVLLGLADKGIVRKGHLDAWKALRHAAAHGAVLEDDEKAFQEHIDRFHVCLDLYYRLVFHLVGFAGRHTDYSVAGWPVAEFPLAVDGVCSEVVNDGELASAGSESA